MLEYSLVVPCQPTNQSPIPCPICHILNCLLCCSSGLRLISKSFQPPRHFVCKQIISPPDSWLTLCSSRLFWFDVSMNSQVSRPFPFRPESVRLVFHDLSCLFIAFCFSRPPAITRSTHRSQSFSRFDSLWLWSSVRFPLNCCLFWLQDRIRKFLVILKLFALFITWRNSIILEFADSWIFGIDLLGLEMIHCQMSWKQGEWRSDWNWDYCYFQILTEFKECSWEMRLFSVNFT